MGKLAVIEGLDGSGKATQTALLADTLQREGQPLQVVSFPDYQSPSSTLVKMYLEGCFGDAPGDVNAYAASSFYAVDRYASWKTGWGDYYRQGGLVLANRYTTANAIHQCAKLPAKNRQDFLYWMLDYEYNKLGLPKPDLVIFLDVEPTVSRELMEQRYAGDESKKDIHERDISYQQASRETALWCAEQLGWHTINCVGNGHIRSPQAIAKQVYTIFKEEL